MPEARRAISSESARESADADEEAEEERDRQRQDDDVREREGEDDPRLGERLLALDEELRELDEAAHGHEAGVGEEADDGRGEHLAEDVAIQPTQHGTMVAGEEAIPQKVNRAGPRRAGLQSADSTGFPRR